MKMRASEEQINIDAGAWNQLHQENLTLQAQLCAQEQELADLRKKLIAQAEPKDITSVSCSASEHTLQEIEARFNQLTENIQSVFWITDIQPKKIVYVSPNYEKIWGRPRYEIYKNAAHWREFIHPQDRALANTNAGILLGGNPVTTEYRILRPDGELRWIRDRGFPVYNEQGKLYRICGIAEDITERKLNEEYNLTQKELLQKIIDNIPVMVVYLNSQGKIEIVNQQFTTSLGWTAADLREIDLIRECYPDDYEMVYQFISEATGEWQDFRTRTRSGEYIDTAWANVRLSGGDLLGIGQVITARKQAEVLRREHLVHELELKTAELKMRELERLNQLKDDFLSTVSHELRTPISNIKIALAMLKKDISEERRQKYMQILEISCERETILIEDLLNLQQAEAGAKPLYVEPIVFQEWLPKLLLPFKVRMQAEGQSLHCEVAPDLPLLITDIESLNRILAELLQNAYKYTASTGHIWLKIQAVDGPAITFTVINDGPMIPESELPRIFEKFYRVPQQDRWQRGGTGLGLALVKQLVERLGGAITVTSQPEQTSFCIALPSHKLIQ